MDRVEEPKLEFRVHLMDLTSDDKHSMQLDYKHVPGPVVSDRRSGLLNLPIGVRIVYVYNLRKLLVRHLTSRLFLQLSQASRKRKTPPCSC